ncbi:hypothetical protein [Brucella pituitosa]|uniref:hypothetical protein n=1 Tax=Brucella pituitosa TaxID=571256 RepID=UPI001260340C|nr:hypothetical protein [Brucella pituitosa]
MRQFDIVLKEAATDHPHMWVDNIIMLCWRRDGRRRRLGRCDLSLLAGGRGGLWHLCDNGCNVKRALGLYNLTADCGVALVMEMDSRRRLLIVVEVLAAMNDGEVFGCRSLGGDTRGLLPKQTAPGNVGFERVPELRFLS